MIAPPPVSVGAVQATCSASLADTTPLGSSLGGPGACTGMADAVAQSHGPVALVLALIARTRTSQGWPFSRPVMLIEYFSVGMLGTSTRPEGLPGMPVVIQPVSPRLVVQLRSTR